MWLALMLAYVFAFRLQIFPVSGAYDFSLQPEWSWEFARSFASHWVLPFLSLFLVSFGGWAIGMRNLIIYELEADYANYLQSLGAPRGSSDATPTATRSCRRCRASRSRSARSSAGPS